MRKLLLAASALGALATSAFAADMAPLPIPPPVLSWTGFYIGGNFGWAGSTDAVTNLGTDSGTGGFGTALLAGGIPGIVNLNETGVIGGGQVGYNWQIAPTWVVGIEADFQGANAKGSNAFAFLGAAPLLPITTTYTRELDWLGTLRARLGYLWFPSLMFYGTGGLAYGENKTRRCRRVPGLGSAMQQRARYGPPELQHVGGLCGRRRRGVEICTGLDAAGRVSLCRVRPLQQHDLLHLRRQHQHADKHDTRARQHRARRSQLPRSATEGGTDMRQPSFIWHRS